MILLRSFERRPDGTATSGEATDLGPGGHTIAANYSDPTAMFQSSGGVLVFTVTWVDVRPKDVAPGQVATILAGGFQVGETVDFEIKNLTTGHDYAPFSVTDGGATDEIIAPFVAQGIQVLRT